jgi:hypothetical protein
VSGAEVERVTRPGGTVVLCPGANDGDGAEHRALVAAGFAWSVFVEPGDAPKRTYWRTVGT